MGIVSGPNWGSVMKVTMIDPGLVNYAGHHADINFAVAREFLSRGCEVEMFANKSFILQARHCAINVKSHFTDNPYQFFSYPHLKMASDFEAYRYELMTIVFLKELAEIEIPDVLLLPTLFSYQLEALGLMQKDYPAISGVVHNHPQWGRPTGDAAWARAFGAVTNKKINIGMLEQELYLEYDNLNNKDAINFSILPLPHDGAVGMRPRNALRRIGILGHQRPAKGSDKLGATVAHLVSMGFEVVIQDAGGRLKQNDENEQIKVFGYVDRIGDLITECDAILLDYDPNMYRFSGSGIGWETIASGVPLVAPRGTTTSKLMGKYNCGARFAASDPQSKYEALSFMRDNYADFAKRSQTARSRYHAENGVKRFVDSVFGMATDAD